MVRHDGVAGAAVPSAYLQDAQAIQVDVPGDIFQLEHRLQVVHADLLTVVPYRDRVADLAVPNSTHPDPVLLGQAGGQMVDKRLKVSHPVCPWIPQRQPEIYFAGLETGQVLDRLRSCLCLVDVRPQLTLPVSMARGALLCRIWLRIRGHERSILYSVVSVASTGLGRERRDRGIHRPVLRPPARHVSNSRPQSSPTTSRWPPPSPGRTVD